MSALTGPQHLVEAKRLLAAEGQNRHTDATEALAHAVVALVSLLAETQPITDDDTRPGLVADDYSDWTQVTFGQGSAVEETATGDLQAILALAESTLGSETGNRQDALERVAEIARNRVGAKRTDGNGDA